MAMMRNVSKSTPVMAAALAAASLLAAPAANAEQSTQSVSSKVIAARSGDLAQMRHQDDRKRDFGLHDSEDLDGGHKDQRVQHSDRRYQDDDRNRDRDRGRDGDADRNRDRDHNRDNDWNRNRDNHDNRYSDRNGHRGNTTLINCGSGDYKATTCVVRAGFRIRDARIYKQKSRTDCDRGRNWELQGNRIWVNDGCRAIFEVSSTIYPGNRYRHDRAPWADKRYGGDVWGRDGQRYHIRSREGRIAANACERHASRRAWNRGRINEGYVGRPDIDFGRYGDVRVSGVMRIDGRGHKGDRFIQTRCYVENGHVVDFDVRR